MFALFYYKRLKILNQFDLIVYSLNNNYNRIYLKYSFFKVVTNFIITIKM